MLSLFIIVATSFFANNVSIEWIQAVANFKYVYLNTEKRNGSCELRVVPRVSKAPVLYDSSVLASSNYSWKYSTTVLAACERSDLLAVSKDPIFWAFRICSSLWPFQKIRSFGRFGFAPRASRSQPVSSEGSRDCRRETHDFRWAVGPSRA